MEIDDLGKIEEQETHGIWFHYHGTFWVKVARYGSAKFEAARRKINKQEINEIGIVGKVTPEVLKRFEDAERELVAEHLLLDWKGVTDKGQDLNFTKQRARKELKNESFYRNIVEFSQSFEDFKVVQDEEDAKN